MHTMHHSVRHLYNTETERIHMFASLISWIDFFLFQIKIQIVGKHITRTDDRSSLTSCFLQIILYCYASYHLYL
jgi:hypothetical protein